MKNIMFCTAAAVMIIAAPVSAQAASLTLRCGVGQFHISNADAPGETRATFRDVVYSESEALCDQKVNAYCSIDKSDPQVLRLKWIMRADNAPTGAVMLAYEYRVNIADGTVTTHMGDRYGDVTSGDPVSTCTQDGGQYRRRVAMQQTVRWPLRVLFD